MNQLILTILLLGTTSAVAEPGLKVGAKAPNISVKDINGKDFSLEKEVKTGPVVLIFYRGGWCPYCNTQLRDIEKKLLPEVQKLKGTVVAISVDTPSEGLKTTKDNKLNFTVLSDPNANILTDYSVKFKVPDSLVKKYKEEYSIDVEAASGKEHHIIAVPAVYVVDAQQTITYAYVNEDYKVRAKIPEVLKALKRTKS